ncbi:MAG: two-component system sensor histidine kinase BaeS [Cellvibrionaceae bacterium]|jgi:two-component system sensor histidine kinase BaeS
MIKLGIRKKLVAAFVGVVLLVILVTFIAVWISFRAGFLQYINDFRYESLVQVSETLSQKIQSESDWQRVVNNPRYWRDFLRQNRSDDRNRRHNRDNRRPSLERFLLLDVNKKHIYGRREKLGELLLIPISIKDKVRDRNLTTSGDRVLGYVGLKPLKNLNNRADKVFVDKQLKFFTVIALFAIAMAVIVAYFLSSWMVSPLQRLVTAMSALMKRDYTVKVDYKANDEISHLVQSFNQLTQTLSQHEKSQQQWIADISHELRTPLTILRGELEAVQDGVRLLNQQGIDSLYEEVLRLQRIVDDLHQLSSSDHGAMRYIFTSASLVDIIQNVLRSQEISLTDHQLANEIIKVGIERPVYGDADRLRQLFQNLLQNSIRYTEKNNAIRVTLNFDNKDFAVVIWEDGPPGAPSSSLARLFDRLYREEKSRNRRQGGSGLGLSICKNIVEAHNGKIKAAHSSLGGLAIDLQLPFAK